MRYVFLSTGSWEGNASMMRPREFGREFIDRGVEVTYLVDDVPWNREHLDVDPRATVVYNPRPGGPLQVVARRRLLAKLRPDFVHVINPAPKTAASLWGSRWRVVGDWDEWPALRPHGAVRGAMERYLDRWLRRRAAVTVVCSRYMQEEFRKRFGVDAKYIPYATYIGHPPDGPSPFAEPTAVYMGNLYPAYDQDIAFEAIERLAGQGKRWPVTFIGGGSDVDKWRGWVNERGLTHVTVKGFVSDADRWLHLRHAHVLLFPIRPTVLNLARCPAKTYAYAQSNRPTITCRVGEVPEVLGEAATYVEPTAEAFAGAIERAMTGPTPDVDYQVGRHNWAARAEALISAVERVRSG